MLMCKEKMKKLRKHFTFSGALIDSPIAGTTGSAKYELHCKDYSENRKAKKCRGINDENAT